ncbi:septal ring lytic transglycosylase RlpA family protein [Rhodoplanes roseus]|uniref:Endolytic peptidoglycan transglycosylase RlpA n=1 Tax=Rhodoplanes roseus TaxID=29409 RepID=A0A327KYX2_9BRAD|nr:septal ring lytic transglycosylase RlpA family protein [Rhodoplanes roseus]RAI43451.1 septal ring lytic transglycosylase RlpA family lipoprotein [Rhodoplanes roseus]
MIRGENRGRLARLARVGAAASACVVLAQCSAGNGKLFPQIDPRYGVSASPRVIDPGDPVPKGGGGYRIGKPYMVGGRMYVPEEDVNYRAEGLASWYGTDFHGRLTANGEVFDMHSMSAAHPTLPMPSYVRVTNLGNNRSIVLRVNDRGPFHQGRLIDVSNKAADMLGFQSNGTARVRVEYVGRAPLEGSDDGLLMATLRQGEPAPPPSLVMVAATRPFVPNLRPSGPLPRSGVPMPPERPFSLGLEDQPASAPTRSGSGRTSQRQPLPADKAPVMAAGRDRDSRKPATPTLAAVESRPARDPLPAVMTGRGLY